MTHATGQVHRLPTEEEREKGARGVDGRQFPWGDLEDASLGKCLDSREERAQPEPVAAFPTATSVYGMIDAAGGSWDWTDSWIDARQKERVLRGGGWTYTVHDLRSATRNRLEPAARYVNMGFRVARPSPL